MPAQRASVASAANRTAQLFSPFVPPPGQLPVETVNEQNVTGSHGSRADLVQMAAKAASRRQEQANHKAQVELSNPALIPEVYNSQTRSSFYRPMACKVRDQPSEMQRLALQEKGFSPNYRGNPDIPRNQPANVPPEQNCSLWLVGLAPDVTCHELLPGIRNVGRVFATHINPPKSDEGHVSSAAKVVFFEREAAGVSFFSFFPPPYLYTGSDW
jgi:hypothetical protein